MENRHEQAIKGMIFFIFWVLVWMCLLVIGRETSSKKEVVFFVVATQFFCKAMCTITTKQHYCRFLIPKRIIQRVRAGFALSTVVETGNFFD